jgi:hypothetical protein
MFHVEFTPTLAGWQRRLHKHRLIRTNATIRNLNTSLCDETFSVVPSFEPTRKSAASLPATPSEVEHPPLHRQQRCSTRSERPEAALP